LWPVPGLFPARVFQHFYRLSLPKRKGIEKQKIKVMKYPRAGKARNRETKGKTICCPMKIRIKK